MNAPQVAPVPAPVPGPAPTAAAGAPAAMIPLPAPAAAAGAPAAMIPLPGNPPLPQGPAPIAPPLPAGPPPPSDGEDSVSPRLFLGFRGINIYGFEGKLCRQSFNNYIFIPIGGRVRYCETSWPGPPPPPNLMNQSRDVYKGLSYDNQDAPHNGLKYVPVLFIYIYIYIYVLKYFVPYIFHFA